MSLSLRFCFLLMLLAACTTQKKAQTSQWPRRPWFLKGKPVQLKVSGDIDSIYVAQLLNGKISAQHSSVYSNQQIMALALESRRPVIEQLTRDFKNGAISESEYIRGNRDLMTNGPVIGQHIWVKLKGRFDQDQKILGWDTAFIAWRPIPGGKPAKDYPSLSLSVSELKDASVKEIIGRLVDSLTMDPKSN